MLRDDFPEKKSCSQIAKFRTQSRFEMARRKSRTKWKKK